MQSVVPDAVLWIVGAVCVAAEPLPGQPAHGWGAGQPVVQRHAGYPHQHQADQQAHSHAVSS